MRLAHALLRRILFQCFSIYSLPKDSGAIRGRGEKFAANTVTDTSSMSVPIATSSDRSDFEREKKRDRLVFWDCSRAIP